MMCIWCDVFEVFSLGHIALANVFTDFSSWWSWKVTDLIGNQGIDQYFGFAFSQVGHALSGGVRAGWDALWCASVLFQRVLFDPAGELEVRPTKRCGWARPSSRCPWEREVWSRSVWGSFVTVWMIACNRTDEPDVVLMSVSVRLDLSTLVTVLSFPIFPSLPFISLLSFLIFSCSISFLISYSFILSHPYHFPFSVYMTALLPFFLFLFISVVWFFILSHFLYVTFLKILGRSFWSFFPLLFYLQFFQSLLFPPPSCSLLSLGFSIL